jgi:hypothetical protein
VYGSTGNVWSRQSKLVAKDATGTTNNDYFRFGSGVSLYDTLSVIGSGRYGMTILFYFLIS